MYIFKLSGMQYGLSFNKFQEGVDAISWMLCQKRLSRKEKKIFYKLMDDV